MILFSILHQTIKEDTWIDWPGGFTPTENKISMSNVKIVRIEKNPDIQMWSISYKYINITN